SVIASAFLSTAKTFAPSRANSTAAARPLPQPGPTQPAPVMSATLPSTRPGMSNLQKPLGVAGIDFGLVRRRQSDLLDHFDALPLQHLQRRCVGAENKVIGPDRFAGAPLRRRMIAG